MRDEIKDVATRLLITNGYRGLRFGDIAEELGTTRANIHYHFGTKENLVEEVIEEYLAGTLDALKAIWTAEDVPFRHKAIRTMEFNRSRYLRFNAADGGGRPWSLISRMRLEADLLTDRGHEALRRFSRAMDEWITDAVVQAQRRGEIAPEAPARDIAIQLIAIVDSAGSITQDAGSFERLEHLYTAYLRIIDHAYGGREAAGLRSVAG
jgi:AcrR family transcriptional regulator